MVSTGLRCAIQIPESVALKKSTANESSQEQSVASSSTRRRTFRTLDIVLTGMIAGTYAAITLLGGELSFGPVNLRFSNALIGLIPILGWPAVFGISLGVFLANILGPNLGPLDIFLSPIFSLIGLVAIQTLKKRSVLLGFLVYSVILSVWINYLLSLFLTRSYFPWFYFTLAGISTIVMLLSYTVYKGLIASGIKRRLPNAI